MLLCFCFNAFGQKSGVQEQQELKNPYYTQQFYQLLGDQVQSDLLVSEIKKILQFSHIKKPNDLDTVVETCPIQNIPGAKCTSQKILGYNRARKVLMGEMYLTRVGSEYAVRDVYCEHEYRESEFKSKKPGPDLIPDDTLVNCEHTWPQSKFNRRHNTEAQKSDLHHLYPSDSKMNSKRSNFNFGEVSGKNEVLKCAQSKFGKGPTSSNWIFEPPHAHKGNVARALFYFSMRYDLPINEAEEAFLRKWHQEDPVDDAELQNHERIYELQDNRNPFVDFPELVEKVSNF